MGKRWDNVRGEKILIGPLERRQILLGCGLEGTGLWSSQGPSLWGSRVQ